MMLEDSSWLFLIIWFMIAIIMAGIFRRVWGFFAIAALALFIESLRGCQEAVTWLIIGAAICFVIAIPLLLKDIKESKQQSLRDRIKYKVHTAFQGAGDDEQELARLEQMSIWSMVGSCFKKKRST